MAIENSAVINMGVLNSVFKLKWKQFCDFLIRLNEMWLYHHSCILYPSLGGFSEITEVIFLLPNSPNPGRLDAVKTRWLEDSGNWPWSCLRTY